VLAGRVSNSSRNVCSSEAMVERIKVIAKYTIRGIPILFFTVLPSFLVVIRAKYGVVNAEARG